jgi:hypothetical protein
MYLYARLPYNSNGIDKLGTISKKFSVVDTGESYILIKNLDKSPQGNPDLKAFNRYLTEQYSEFREEMTNKFGKNVYIDVYFEDGKDVYTDVYLEEPLRMHVKENGRPSGYVLLHRPSAKKGENIYEILDPQELSRRNPYIGGYGSLLKHEELEKTFGEKITIGPYGNYTLVKVDGYKLVFGKKPTRNWWNRPEDRDSLAVLNIEKCDGSSAYFGVFHANAEKYQQHKTFERETDYKFMEIPPEDINLMGTNTLFIKGLREGRPLYVVEQFRIKEIENPKTGVHEIIDIVANPHANPPETYIKTILEGLSQSTTDLKSDEFMVKYLQTTYLPDGRPLGEKYKAPK